MSLNYQQTLQPVSCMDGRISYDITEDDVLGTDDGEKLYGNKYLVYKGPKNIEYFLYPPTSGDGNSSNSTDWSYFMPSRETVLDRVIFLKATIAISMKNTSDTNASGAFLQQNRFGLQAFPLHHCIKILQLQIDGTVYSVDLTNSFEHMKYYNYTEDEIKTWASLCPTMLDNTFIYQTGVSSDPLVSQTSVGTSFVPSRGGFGYSSLRQRATDGANNTKSDITYTVTEPIFLSPLIVNAIRQSTSCGLTGMANIKIKITWKSPTESFNYGFKLNPYATPNTAIATMNQANQTAFSLINTTFGNPNYLAPGSANATVSLIQPYQTNGLVYSGTLTISGANLILGVLTMPDTSITPPINSYDFFKYETHTESEDIVAGGEQKHTFKTYNLSQVPHAVLIAVTPYNDGTNYTLIAGKTNIPINTLPDMYFGINNINIKLGNRSGLLSNAPPELLYQFNRQNGLNFCNFSNTNMQTGGSKIYVSLPDTAPTDGTYEYLYKPGQGCPLLLRFGKDIAIDDASLAPGCAVNTTFQATITFNNPFTTATNTKVQFTIIYLYDGIYTTSTSGASFVTSVLSREDVLSSESERIDMTELVENSQGGVLGGVMVGGSFMSKLKKIGKKAWNVVSNKGTQRFLRRLLNTADILDVPGASALNAAVNTTEDAWKAAQGQGMHRGGVLGGNMLTADQIRKRLMY